jgi:acetylornithine aminotransferase
VVRVDGPIDLTRGDFREGLPPFVQRALAEAAARRFGYPPIPGLAQLREAVARWVLRRYGVDVDPDTQVISCNGAKEAIYHLHGAVAGDPDRPLAVHPDPGYPVYAGAARAYGLTPHPAGPDLAGVPDDVLARAAVVWVNSPHNPTGTTLSRDELGSLADRCRAAGTLLAGDDAYGDVHDETAAPPAGTLEAGPRGVVAVVTLSKRSGLTGLRSGALIGDPDWIARLLAARAHVGAGTPVFVQHAAAAAWDDDAHVAPRRAAITRRRALLASAMAAAGAPPAPATAGLYLWCDAGSPEGAQRLRTRLRDEVGVLVEPGSSYGASGARFLRVSLAAPDEETRAAAGRLAALAIASAP